jgi:hypothetical protein
VRGRSGEQTERRSGEQAEKRSENRFQRVKGWEWRELELSERDERKGGERRGKKRSSESDGWLSEWEAFHEPFSERSAESHGRVHRSQKRDTNKTREDQQTTKIEEEVVWYGGEARTEIDESHQYLFDSLHSGSGEKRKRRSRMLGNRMMTLLGRSWNGRCSPVSPSPSRSIPGLCSLLEPTQHPPQSPPGNQGRWSTSQEDYSDEWEGVSRRERESTGGRELSDTDLTLLDMVLQEDCIGGVIGIEDLPHSGQLFQKQWLRKPNQFRETSHPLSLSLSAHLLRGDTWCSWIQIRWLILAPNK